ncbi:MAG: prepilin-type N-terminal cleavage/methylation domain-containing protein [Candidatus Rokubacteria bacterium]|nr:prepilin-type N-terminal cleavage/methylation domain-containing protein [Candidatus Rokubacteria bacterium]
MRERGFTLIETLIAIAILTVGIIGVGATLAIQTSGVASGISFGQAAVTRGHYVSTAAMLAQERMEQVKRLTYTVTVDDFGGGSTPTGLSDEDYNTITIPGYGNLKYGNFKRQVRVEHTTPAANMKTIKVTVTYKLPKEASISEESLTIGTIIAARP